MKLRPLHDRVIIKRLDTERKTASGIVSPENAAEKPDQGEILAVGSRLSIWCLSCRSMPKRGINSKAVRREPVRSRRR